MTQEDFDAQMSAQESRFAETNEHFCDAVVDKETGEQYVSIEDAEELFDNDFKETCVQFAIGGALLRDKGFDLIGGGGISCCIFRIRRMRISEKRRAFSMKSL